MSLAHKTLLHCFKGWLFDPEEGGLHISSEQIIYIHPRLGKKIFFLVYRIQNINFQPQHLLKQKILIMRMGNWGGGGRGRSEWLVGCRTEFSMNCKIVFRLLARNIVYIYWVDECFDSCFSLFFFNCINVYSRITKQMWLKVDGVWGPPTDFLKHYSYKMVHAFWYFAAMRVYKRCIVYMYRVYVQIHMC